MFKRPLFFVFLALCAGIWVCSIFHIHFLFERILPPSHIKNFTGRQPANACLTAIITTDPTRKEAAYNRVKTQFIAKALSIEAPQKADVCGLINVVSFDDRDAVLEYGDFILIKGDLSRPLSLKNPGCFDYSEYMARQSVYSVITVKKGDFIAVIKKDKANHFIKSIFNFKRRLSAFIKEYMPGVEGDIMSGILLGDRSAIENDLKGRFIKTGTVHVLVISGLNVGLIASIFILVLKFLPLPRFIIYTTASILIAVYAVLTGSDVPVERAAIMAVAVLMGMAFKRRIDILNCLGLAGIIILLKNPESLFDPGFQLSFATVISIIIFAPKIEELLKVDFKEKFILKYLKKSIAVSLAAWVGIIPIIARHFNIISPVCVLANIPVVFFLGLANALGLAFLAVAFFSAFLSSIFAAALEFLAAAAIKAVIFFSRLPFGFFWTHKWSAAEVSGFYILLFIFGLSLYKKNFPKRYVTAGILALLNIFVWADILAQASDYQLKATVLDVGHGDAIVLQFPDNACALIDTGKKSFNFDAGLDVISPFLRAERIKRIDAVFITHSDDDHSGGLKSILKNFKVSNIFDNSKLKFSDKITGFKGAEILVLNPPIRHFSGIESEDNNNSLALKLTCAGRSFMFCADLEEHAMGNMLKYKPYLKADVIKIPHHGAGVDSSGRAFIKAVSAKIALISGVKKDVSDSLLNLLYDLKCQVYKTYSDGAITVVLRNGQISLAPRPDRPRDQVKSTRPDWPDFT